MILHDKPLSAHSNYEYDLPLRQIFEKSYSGLVHFSYSIIGDQADAEDIVQDAIVNYLQTRDKVSPDLVAIKCFLYAVVKNRSFNYIKHKKVIRKFQDQLLASEQEEEPVENQIIRSEVLSALYRAIDSLPSGCRAVSRLSFLEGKKNDEIAEELGISVNTVKCQKMRAKQILKQRLSPELFAVFLFIVQV